jgi:hypothetical protein
MTDVPTKPPTKASPPFDTSEWDNVIKEFEARASRHDTQAKGFSTAIFIAALVGFGAFVFAGTITAFDTVDFYTETQSIKHELNLARVVLEKIPTNSNGAIDMPKVQDALTKVQSAADAASRMEQSSQPDGKELEEIRRRHLISTVTTRISAASLLAFLVALLANLYRHNVRLAAFYRSRVDALKLTKQSGVAAFERLAKSLLPDGLDPGKGPETPTKQAVEFAKAIAKATSSESKSAKTSS